MNRRLRFMSVSLLRAAVKNPCPGGSSCAVPSRTPVSSRLAGIGARKHKGKIINIRAKVCGQRAEIQPSLRLGERVSRSGAIERFDQRDAIEGPKRRGLRRRLGER